MKSLVLTLAALPLAASPAGAQSCVTSSQAATASLYAPVCISLLPGFETTTAGFEARIRPPEATAGRWSALLPWTNFQRTAGGPLGLVGIHTHVLPSGQVLTWEGHNDDVTTDHTSHAYTWNPNPAAVNGSLSYPNVYDHYDNYISNIFCSGHTFLADGRLLVAGGHYSNGEVVRVDNRGNYDSNLPVNDPTNLDYIPPGNENVNGSIGLRDVNLYNYLGNERPNSGNYFWQSGFGSLTSPPSQMAYRRWYPTATTLADGRVLVVAGQLYGGYGTTAPGNELQMAVRPEIFTPTSLVGGSWQTVPTADRKLPYYPWMFLLPSGLVFNAGPNYRTGYFNPTASPVAHPDGTSPAIQPNTWGDGPLPILGTPNQLPATNYNASYRGYGSAVLYQPGKILVLGGAGPAGVTNTTELLDFGQTNPQWQRGAPMRYPRHHPNATLLADGSVLVSGGSQQASSSDGPAVLPAELWTPNPQAPTGGSWQQMAALDAPRLYHSTALLLPDATVLTTGGGQGGYYPDHPDYQIFTPPYLCQPTTTRPSISYAPPTVAYGQSFKVQSPNAGGIVRATWVRLSSVTHSFNMNQRFLELPFTYPAASVDNAPADELVLTAPGSATSCPPGHYMLFLLNGQGVPSVASIMQVSASACAASLSLTATQTRTSACAGTIRFEVSASAGNQADYKWEVNGTAVPASNGQAYYVYSATNNSPTATVQVTATRSCAGPAAVAGQQVTMYFKGCSGQPYERTASR